MQVRRLLCLVLLLSTGAAAQVPMFRNDLAHTGVSTSPGVPKFSHIRWTFPTHGEIFSTPAIVDGVVYIGSNDGHLYAIDQQSGAQKWAFAAQARIPSSPAVDQGAVYFGSYDGNFYAVDAATGKLRWKFATPGEHRFTAPHMHGTLPAGETMPDPFDVYLSSPAVSNGTVYFGSGDGNVYALDAAAGTVRWKFKTGDVVHASPAIAGGKLYIGSWDSFFYALDAATGKEIWRFKTGEDPENHNQQGIQSSATIANGIVYFGCRDSNLYALDAATGEKRWAFNNKGSWVITSPVVHEGKLYFATSDTATLNIVDAATGAPVDSVKFRWPIFSSPAVAGGTLYLAGQDGILAAIDLASHKVAWTFQTEGSRKNLASLSTPDGKPDYMGVFHFNFYDDIQAGLGRMRTAGMFLGSPVVAGSAVYIGSADGNLYALE